jgi:hypothetical protein
MADMGHRSAALCLAVLTETWRPLASTGPQLHSGKVRHSSLPANGGYLDKCGQTAKARANREKALLSHLFNKGREWRYTDAPNPCQG